eukprot:448458-Amphidinium_carterae.1
MQHACDSQRSELEFSEEPLPVLPEGARCFGTVPPAQEFPNEKEKSQPKPSIRISVWMNHEG